MLLVCPWRYTVLFLSLLLALLYILSLSIFHLGAVWQRSHLHSMVCTENLCKGQYLVLVVGTHNGGLLWKHSKMLKSLNFHLLHLVDVWGCCNHVSIIVWYLGLIQHNTVWQTQHMWIQSYKKIVCHHYESSSVTLPFLRDVSHNSLFDFTEWIQLEIGIILWHRLIWYSPQI